MGAVFTSSSARKIARVVRANLRRGASLGSASGPAPGATGYSEVQVAGRTWARDDWTGTKSRYLKVPFDGVTAPSYVTSGTWAGIDFSTEPAPGDVRNDALYVDLGRRTLFVPRA